MHARALAFVAAVVACVAVAAAPAAARTTRAEDARERAHVHWQSGSERYAAGQFAAALDEFEAGYAAQPSPAFLVNIGQCLRKLDRLDEAALAFAASSTRTPARRARASTSGTRSKTSPPSSPAASIHSPSAPRSSAPTRARPTPSRLARQRPRRAKRSCRRSSPSTIASTAATAWHARWRCRAPTSRCRSPRPSAADGDGRNQQPHRHDYQCALGALHQPQPHSPLAYGAHPRTFRARNASCASDGTTRPTTTNSPPATRSGATTAITRSSIELEIAATLPYASGAARARGRLRHRPHPEGSWRRLARRAVGIDLSPGMLRKARARGLDVVHGSVTDLPFGDGEFDLAYSFKVLAHVERIERALGEMARVVRPGGHVIAEFYNPWSLRGLIKRLKPATQISTRDHRRGGLHALRLAAGRPQHPAAGPAHRRRARRARVHAVLRRSTTCRSSVTPSPPPRPTRRRRRSYVISAASWS